MNNNERLEQKLDILDMRLDSMDKTLVKQEINLRQHMERSDKLELMIGALEKDLKPVQKHVIIVEGIFKLIGALSMLLGILATVLNILGVI